jgi:hypothetical protein
MLGLILGAIGFLRIAVWSQFTDIYGPHWLHGRGDGRPRAGGHRALGLAHGLDVAAAAETVAASILPPPARRLSPRWSMSRG